MHAECVAADADARHNRVTPMAGHRIGDITTDGNQRRRAAGSSEVAEPRPLTTTASATCQISGSGFSVSDVAADARHNLVTTMAVQSTGDITTDGNQRRRAAGATSANELREGAGPGRTAPDDRMMVCSPRSPPARALLAPPERARHRTRSLDR